MDKARDDLIYSDTFKPIKNIDDDNKNVDWLSIKEAKEELKKMDETIRKTNIVITDSYKDNNSKNNIDRVYARLVRSLCQKYKDYYEESINCYSLFSKL